MMTQRNNVDLPEDLVVEILSRVPTISLARFRSTSKGWIALIKDGRFAEKHSATNPQRQSLALMVTGSRVYLVSVDLHGIQGNKVALKSQLISLKDPLCDSSEEVDIRSVSHCNGLLLCATEDDRLVVWNPVSGETKWIQPGNSYSKSGLSFQFFALGYDSKSSRYKIIRMGQVPLEDGAIYQSDYEIYDFSSNTWSVVVSVMTGWSIPECRSRGVSVKENTYWLAHIQLFPSLLFTLISFDYSTERFQRHLSPVSLLYPDFKALSVVREDQLCLLGFDGSTNLEVWMASKNESTGVISWSKFLTAKVNYNCYDRMMISFLADEQNKVVAVCCSNNILYIVVEGRYIQVDHHCAESSRPFILSYVPTLAQIQRGT